MTVDNDQNWYVLRTKPRQEKAVRQLLSEIGVENFLPTRVEEHQYINQRKKKIEVPLITSTCFMRCGAADRFDIVNGLKYKTILVTDRFTKTSMVIPDKQMADFMLVLSLEESHPLQPVDISEGDRVVVTEGEMRGVEGVVAKINGRRHFVLVLNNLASFMLQIPMSSVKKID